MKHEQERLERYVHRALRSLPPYRAPASLQERVLAQIERRAHAAQHAGFASWPIAARVVFVIASVGLVKAALLAGTWLSAPFDSASQTLPTQLSWVHALVDVASRLYHSLPASWVYGALFVLAVAYALLFGAGAAAYRTLQTAR